MADYFTRFSCLLDVGTPDKAARAFEAFMALRNDAYAETEDLHCGFDLSIQTDPSGLAMISIVSGASSASRTTEQNAVRSIALRRSSVSLWCAGLSIS